MNWCGKARWDPEGVRMKAEGEGEGKGVVVADTDEMTASVMRSSGTQPLHEELNIGGLDGQERECKVQG